VRPDPYAAQRAAFLAEERKRQPAAPIFGEEPDRQPAAPTFDDDRHEPTWSAKAKPERSMWMAYLLWFLIGQFSSHRFYLGATGSAFTQLGMLFVGVILAANGGAALMASLFLLVPWLLWLLADAFLIPGLHKRHCAGKTGADEARNAFA
jgi:TM2 domain-containing membrane protein YozV